MDAIKIHDLFDLTHTRAEKMLAACEYPWEALSQIGETVLEIGRTLDLGAYDHPAADVWIAKSATVAATASITGPCVIGEKTEVRPGAFIRGNVLVGDGAVVGAQAVVTRDVPPMAVVAGCPARIVRMRDGERPR